MSQENVELACAAYEAFNRRDLEAFVALMDENVTADSRLTAMEGGYHGHEGSRRWWRTLLDAMPDFTLDVVEVRDLGSFTLAVLRNRAHGGGSRTPLEETLWHVGEWTEGKCVWWGAYLSEGEALAAVGQRE